MKTLVCYFNVDGFAIQLKNHLESALDELQIEWQECHVGQLSQTVASFQPTMTIFFHPSQSILDNLDVIQAMGGHKLLWSMEDPYESDITFALLPYVYYIFTSDENTAEALRKEATANQIFFVPHAFNPKVHKPEEVPYEYRSDILFVGNAYESRLKFFQNHAQEYKDKMVTIIGVGYRGLDGYQSQRVIHGHISETEMVKYINGAKLVLNLHRQSSDLDMANKRKIAPSSFNNRYYEVMGCNRKQLVVGRGPEFVLEPVEINREDLLAHGTYKAILTKYYLPLLKQ